MAGLLSKIARWAFPSARKRLDILVVQDSNSVQNSAKLMEKGLRDKGLPVFVHSLDNGGQTIGWLDGIRDKDHLPQVFLLDCVGAGVALGAQLLDWFSKNRPDRAMPEIYFLSVATEMAASEAAQLKIFEPEVETGFVDKGELVWVKGDVAQRRWQGKPETDALRRMLNRNLNTGYSLETSGRVRQTPAPNIKKVLLQITRSGNYPVATALERLRNDAFASIDRLKTLSAGTGHSAIGETQADAVFYDHSSAVYAGPAIFHPDDAEAVTKETGLKPVLFMQSYDPAVVPLLSGRKIGALVAVSPYMGAHLKMLCDANRITGLFGLIPPGREGLSGKFNELAKPDLPPYFTGDDIRIAGQKLARGQIVIAGLPGQGLALQPPALTAEKLRALNRDAATQEDIRQDRKSLRQINTLMERLFAERKERVHRVKANIDSACSDDIGAIGLVRTEQMVSASPGQAALAKYILLNEDHQLQCSQLGHLAQTDYNRLGRTNASVRVRLFDFSPRELLTVEEQKELGDRHGTSDIRGGAALKKWPLLYQAQIDAIFETSLKYPLSEYESHTETPRLEIMMPAVRTEEDILAVKAIIEESAGANRARRGHNYLFGTMVETVKCCENIEDIARHCDFLSFGTNDLTEEYFAMTRGNLLARSQFAARNGYDPFKTLAPDVLEVIGDVIARARKVNPKIQIDVCGAQAADLATAEKLFSIGIDNISVAPTPENLCVLPAELNYRRFDALNKPPRASAEQKPQERASP